MGMVTWPALTHQQVGGRDSHPGGLTLSLPSSPVCVPASHQGVVLRVGGYEAKNRTPSLKAF